MLIPILIRQLTFAALILCLFPKPFYEASTAIPEEPEFLLKTPQEIAGFIRKNFSFETDRRQFGVDNQWQDPGTLLRTKKGDCEDFALFYKEMLGAHGLSSLLICLYGEGKSHAITMYRRQGKTVIMDDDEIKMSKTNNLREILSEVYPWWKNFKVVRFSSGDGKSEIISEFIRV